MSLRKSLYPKIETQLNQAAKFLHQKGFTPNQLTLLGVAVNFIAGWIYASGHFFLGAVAVILASAGDLLDGPLARSTGQTTSFGAFLDSTLDRYSDFFIFGGAAIYYGVQADTFSLLLCLSILAGAFATSYSKSRAEALGVDCHVGVFERAERIMIFLVGSIFFFLMPLALWVLAIGTNATAIQRILFTKNELSKKS